MDKQPIILLIKSLSFLFYAFIIYVFFLIFWGDFAPVVFKKNLNYFPAGYGHLNTRIKEISNFKNVDVLVLGSSHAYRGFDTRIFNKNKISCFNLGSSSQTPAQTYVLIERYIDVFLPKLVIYEVNPMLFNTDGIESSLDLLSNDKIDFFSFQMAVNQNHIKVYNSLIYSAYCNLLNRNSKINQPKVVGEDTYVSGGFVEKKLKHYTIQETLKGKDFEMKISQLDYFEKIVNIIKNKNIEILFVQAPVTKVKYNSYSSKKHFNSQISKYGYFIDFNNLENFNDSIHFYDNHHMNQLGVELMNKMLIDSLKLFNQLNNDIPIKH